MWEYKNVNMNVQLTRFNMLLNPSEEIEAVKRSGERQRMTGSRPRGSGPQVAPGWVLFVKKAPNTAQYG